jgi:hypothetical protein
MAEIPVLLLRERLSPRDLETLPYSALITRGQRELDRLVSPPNLVLDAPSRSICIAEHTAFLTPLEFAVYSLLAKRRAAGCGNADCPGCPDCSLEAGAFLDTATIEAIRTGVQMLGARDDRTRSLQGWKLTQDRGPQERFLEIRSRINRKVRQALGPGRWADRYCIQAHRTPGALSRYCIPIDPRQIVAG